MNKIVSLQKAIEISQNIKIQKKTIVLGGGCFDILHIGHIKFLEKAKKYGNYLFVLLESDATVKKLKGKERPINNQKDRAGILSAINFVDYVVLLGEIKNNEQYDKMVFDLKPNIIAVTKNDPKTIHNKRQAKMINAKVVSVINRLTNKSSSNLSKLIAKNF